MITLSLKDIYLWKERSSYNRPWSRQYLDQEFLKNEKKLIKDAYDLQTYLDKLCSSGSIYQPINGSYRWI